MNALEIKNLSKSYGDFALHDLNLTLPEGCIMGLIGENGAGKSTTIKLILDMIRRDGGSVTILGSEDVQLKKEDIGIVLDEVGLPACLNAKQINRIMRLAYKNWDEKTFFGYVHKFDLPENKEFKAFSRGMKMKMGIAVALSHNAKLLVLDEATNGLDPVARDEVVEELFEFTRDEHHAILISSHIVSDLERLCDYIAFLHKGRLMLCEEKDVLRSEYGIVRCTAAELDTIAPEAVIGTRVSPYGAEAIVLRSAVPEGMTLGPVSIEELFVFMVKGEKA